MIFTDEEYITAMLRPLSQVSGFPPDLMHSGHSRAILMGIMSTFGVELSKASDNIPHKWKDGSIHAIDTILQNWRSSIPNEYNRQPQGLSLIKKWKMRETYVTGTKLIPAMAATKGGFVRRNGENVPFRFMEMSELQLSFFQNYIFLAVGLRLVSANQMKSMPMVSIAIFFASYILLY